MRVLRKALQLCCLALVLPLFGLAQSASTYRYFRTGSPLPMMHPRTEAGFALMGGGADSDEAFQWLCSRAGGGDLLVLRATGDDDYNPYIQKLCHLNSVATLVIPDRKAAFDPLVDGLIAQASAIFIAGGDQANYINFWMNTPVQSKLNAAIERGVPIGGTSAGLAVLGEWAYSAQGDRPNDPNLSGAAALADPMSPRVTLVHGFLRIPALQGIVTDTHFAARDRMGRMLVFLSRLQSADQEGPPAPVRGIAVDQGAAVLLTPDGKAMVAGHGNAWFIAPEPAGKHAEPVLAANHPLDSAYFKVARVTPGHSFNLATWSAPEAGSALVYTLSVESGVIHSSQPDGKIY